MAAGNISRDEDTCRLMACLYHGRTSHSWCTWVPLCTPRIQLHQACLMPPLRALPLSGQSPPAPAPLHSAVCSIIPVTYLKAHSSSRPPPHTEAPAPYYATQGSHSLAQQHFQTDLILPHHPNHARQQEPFMPLTFALLFTLTLHIKCLYWSHPLLSIQFLPFIFQKAKKHA